MTDPFRLLVKKFLQMSVLSLALSGLTTGHSVLVNRDAALKGSLSADNDSTLSLSVESILFDPQPVGMTSTPQTVMLTNLGTGNLVVTKVNVPAGFIMTDENCTAGPLTPGNACILTVSFEPGIQGLSEGTLTFTSNASDFPNSVYLSGTGTDFLFPTPGTAATLSGNIPAIYELTISGGPGFSASIGFACSNMPKGTKCVFTPSSVNPGSGSATVTLTVSRERVASLFYRDADFQISLSLIATIFVLGMLGSYLRYFMPRWRLICALMLAATMCNACAESDINHFPLPPSGPAAGRYTFQVTPIVSGSLLDRKSVAVDLEVQ
jgi:hypothetical protein